ncbi:hypothetical protein JJV70_04595 [Streptomyces sp. JJ66]|uniref:hypothetical protein n=1 Tax=Streptomyces sp. JJ66 TaxID=2803843 RepID=UPI001C594D68|nr:hypothetical protein [Streptomyces sp. JJ66]MBW1601395.1 hypothetical protein [Streptomyces sp. JJ66]
MGKQYGRLAAVAAAALVAAGGLAACTSGGDGLADQSGQQVEERAREALKSARSLRFTIRGDQQDTASIDFMLDRDGNCAGTTSMGEQGSAEIIKRGDVVWFKPDRTFWEAQAGQAGADAYEAFAGRYLTGPASDPMMEDFAAGCQLRTLQDGMKSGGAEWSDPAKGEVDGEPVVTITAESGERTHTIDVAAQGEPYPVRLVEKADGSTTTTTLSDFDEPVPSETPSAKESVDVKKVQKELAGG